MWKNQQIFVTQSWKAMLGQVLPIGDGEGWINKKQPPEEPCLIIPCVT